MDSARSFYRYWPVSERDRRWGLFVTTAGESRIPPHTVYPPGGHPEGYAFEWGRGRVLQDLQLIYISRGRGQFESSRSPVQTVEPGTVMILSPGVWHRYRPDEDTGWHEHWVGMDGPMVQTWVREGFVQASEPLVRVRREELLLELFAEMMSAVRENRPALQQVIASIGVHMHALTFSDRQACRTGDDTALDPIRQAIQRMHSEFSGSLDAPTLARDLKVSYSSFRRGFAQHTGLSPHQYLLELRLARARSLLGETLLSIKEVAAQSGFPDEHYFSRLFHRRTGLAPGTWRTRAQSPPPAGREVFTNSSSPNPVTARARSRSAPQPSKTPSKHC